MGIRYVVQVLTPRPLDMTDLDMPIPTGDVPVHVRTYQAEPEIFAAELVCRSAGIASATIAAKNATQPSRTESTL